MSPLQKALRPASFRGVRFQVEDVEYGGGRRLVTFEYPQRDVPNTQDLGRSARSLEFDAFLVGEDYVAQANNLLVALEKGGAATLVHPWFGSMTVNAGRYRLRLNRALGFAAISISCVESGALEFPQVAIATPAASKKAAGSLLDALKARFAGVFKTLGYINYVASQAIVYYGKVLTILSNPLFALASSLGFGTLPGNLSSLAALISDPAGLVTGFSNLLDISGLAKAGAIGTSDAITVPMVSGLTAMATSAALAAPADAPYSTATMAQVQTNQAAILASARQNLLVQAVGLSSYIQCAVYDDTIAVRDLLAAALDAEALQADGDGLYFALMDARAAMWNDLTTRSANAARLLTWTPPVVMPMLVVAYRFYGDAARADEITARNKIANPGFVPVEALQVLSS